MDTAAGCLVDAKKMQVLPACPGTPQRGGVFTTMAKTAPCYKQLLVEFQAVLNESGGLPASTHGVEHHLPTSGRPVSARFRRLSPQRYEAAKREFAKLEKQGIVRRSSSCWASPLHMVRKPDGSWRPCGDFRRLNLITVPDKYPLPRMEDLSARLAGCKVFSKLDLKQGYHQIPMRPADISKTAIITPFGLFEYTRMPFGLRNSGQSFQRLMDKVLQGLEGVFCYLDDILVASPSEEAHMAHLRALLQRLQQSGLVLNLQKCQFGVAHVEFLGHAVDAGGARPLDDKVAAVRSIPPPTTVKELQAFLGMINFYRRFLPSIARTLSPLTDALKGGGKGATPVAWSPAREAAFQEAKAALCSATTLAHPDQQAVLSLMVDASATHIGAVLQQRRICRVGWEPLGFYSKKLAPAQVNYSAFDRELYAVVCGIRHFRYMLEGRAFTIFTDHKPLTFALGRSTEPWIARQQRHLAYVAEFSSDIRHVSGQSNKVADFLSRPATSGPSKAVVTPGHVNEPSGSWPAATAAGSGANLAAIAEVQPSTSGGEPVDYTAMAAAQATCPDTLAVRQSSTLKVKTFTLGGTELYCDISTGVVRPVVPAVNRQAVFRAVHGLAHPGTRATRQMISARFLWPGMAKDISAWCKDCQQCARGKVTTHVHTQELHNIYVLLIWLFHTFDGLC